MADRTLTINHADGGSETYTLKTEDVLGVRSMSVDGETVTIDRTAPDLVRTIIADGQTITIDTTREGVRTLTVDGTEITLDRTEESNLDSFLQEFTGASAAYSLRDLASTSGDTTVVRVRRASDNCEKDFKAKEVTDIEAWVNAQTVPPLDLQELDAEGHRTGAVIGASAAYSLRNLSSSYTGYVVDVRRSSDDTEVAFTAAEVADGTLVTWVGAGNDGFVSQWYDQSGNNNHATQGTFASQPKIVDAGTILTDANGKPKLTFNGSTQLFETSVIPPNTATLIGVANWDVENQATFLIGARDSTDQRSYIGQVSGGVTALGVADDARPGQAVTAGTDYLIFGTHSGSTRLISTNGTVSSDAVGSAPNNNTFGYHIGAFNDAGTDSAFMDGSISEIIIYDSDQSDNRTAFESNIGDHYSIDLPSGVDTGYDEVDGFVETWYDQSGNGNDAVQEVAGSQPKIVDAGALVTGGIDFDGVNDHFDFTGGKPITSIDAASAFFVGSSDSSSNQCGLNISSSTSSRRFYLPILHSGSFRFGYAGSISAVSLASSNTSEHLFTGIAGTFTAVGYYDGELKGIVGSGT